MLELTISQIRSLSGTITDNLIFSTNNGQQGIWQYDPGSSSVSAPDNLGTILNTSDGKVFRRIAEGPVNVKWFGAKGDGVADDTNAIQQSLNALAAKGGSVYMPTGIYRITGTIQLKNGVSLSGEYTQNNSVLLDTVIKYEGTGAAIQCYTADPDAGVGYAATYSNIILKGFYLEDVLGTGSMGLDLRGFRWCRLQDVTVSGFNIGLHTYHNYYATYRNLLFRMFKTHGIYAESQDNNTIWDKIKLSGGFADPVTGDVPSQHAARFSYALNIKSSNISCETNTLHGVLFDNSRGVIVSGYYYEAGKSGLVSALLLTACVGVTVTGGAFQGFLKAMRGVYAHGSDDVVVSGNWFNGFSGDTIVNSPMVNGASKKFLQFNNRIDEVNGDYDKLFTLGQGGGEQIGFRQVEWCYYDAVPVYGVWKKGDIVWKKTAETGQPMGFICITSTDDSVTPAVAATWVPFGQMGARTVTAAPNFVPYFLGEEVFDSTAKKWYKSVGNTVSSWVAIN